MVIYNLFSFIGGNFTVERLTRYGLLPVFVWPVSEECFFYILNGF